MVDHYAVKIVRIEGATPKCHISDETMTIVYVYDGDVSRLVLMAQRAGKELTNRRVRIPLLSTTELSS